MGFSLGLCFGQPSIASFGENSLCSTRNKFVALNMVNHAIANIPTSQVHLWQVAPYQQIKTN